MGGIVAGIGSFFGGPGGVLGNNQVNPNSVREVTPVDLSQINQSRDLQMQALKSYGDALSGQAPSIAQQQLQQATNKNLQQIYGMGASARGSNAALAQRQALRAGAEAQQNAAAQAGLLRAQEYANALQGNAALASQIRQGDTFQQGLLQQNQGMGIQRDIDLQKIISGTNAGATESKQNVVKGVASALPGIASFLAPLFSDKEVKEDIKDGGKEVGEFLDALKAKSFKYKDDVNAPKGKLAGVIAQDMEKSKLGKSMVLETDNGKAVDPTKALSTALAAAAYLHGRVKKLEAKHA